MHIKKKDTTMQDITRERVHQALHKIPPTSNSPAVQPLSLALSILSQIPPAPLRQPLLGSVMMALDMVEGQAKGADDGKN